ncbi:MAG TPA: helix-turn-helix domain-containing protein [Opitutaceae bacterium]|jgi:AraC family L-rhamnose operon transcriptional activator RhaR
MRHFRLLLIDRADICTRGLRIITFALHRHLPKHHSIEPHRHSWSQVILYLGGQGRQIFKQGAAEVGAGGLVVLPPGVSHGFQRTTDRAPLCLMIDFRLKGERLHPVAVCSLDRSELLQVRQNLARLLNLQAGSGGTLHLESAAVILQLLVTMLRAAGWIEGPRTPPKWPNGEAIHRLLTQLDPTAALSHVVRRSGYHRDHLNRLLKRETGLTLGQLRAQQRLAKAKELLSNGVQVGNVAAMVGFPDQSYFARWFRRQSGQRPSQWSRRAFR